MQSVLLPLPRDAGGVSPSIVPPPLTALAWLPPSTSAALGSGTARLGADMFVVGSDAGSIHLCHAETGVLGLLSAGEPATAHPVPAAERGGVSSVGGSGGVLGAYGVCGLALAADMLAAACSDGVLRFMTLTKNSHLAASGVLTSGAPTSAAGGKPAPCPLLVRDQKSVVAAAAALLCVRASPDGTAFLTGGEDGSVKVWSRAGMLRSTLVSAGKPVYAVAWNADSNAVAYATGTDITILPLSGSEAAGLPAGSGATPGGARSRGSTWRAHEALVTCLDWSAVTGHLLSGGDDCCYKVWDALGRELFASPALTHVVTSVAWAPRGDTFMVGAFNHMRLCDASGWSIFCEQLDLGAASGSAASAAAAVGCAQATGSGSSNGVDVGSLYAAAWSPDGTMLAAGCATGKLRVSTYCGRRVTLGAVDILQVAPNKLCVTDVSVPTASSPTGAGAGSSALLASSDAGVKVHEVLEFRERVVTFVAAHAHLIVVCATHMTVFQCPAWGTPHTVDTPKAPVAHVVISSRHFCAVDVSGTMTVYAFDGRIISSPKANPLRVDALHRSLISISPDTLAVADRNEGGRVIRCYDVRMGRALAGVISHHLPIVQLALSQGLAGGLPERRLAFVDSSLDLYITPLLKPQPYKLSAMIDSIAWNEAADMLTCLGDGQCTTWLVPSAASTDSELCAAAKVTSDATLSTLLGPSPSILRAAGPRLCVLKADGSLLHITTSYYAPILYEAVAGGKWEAALRLARFVKHDALWSALAILALNARNLNAAEVALAAVKRVDKLEWVLKVKRLALPELQQAEMMVYKRQVEDAEGILLQATPPLVYRAIKLNVRLARWERALALALQHNVHVDTVLWYRRQYLASLHRPEHVEAYLKAAATVGDLNVDAIRSKKAAEKAKEATRAGASASAGAGGGAKPKPTAAASSDGKGSDDMPEHDL